MKEKKIPGRKLLWLYLFGSLFGVVMEGLFCLFRYGRWETHVISLIAPLCIIYGFGAVGCYIGCTLLRGKSLLLRFAAYSAVGFLLELLCGLSLEYGLSMRAWDYTGQRWNIHGHVSLQMSLAWGLIGILFSALVPALERGFDRLDRPGINLLAGLLTLVLAVDFCSTAAVVTRWSRRHFGAPARNSVELYIDRKYDDSFMEHRFCEWRFLPEDEGPAA